MRKSAGQELQIQTKCVHSNIEPERDGLRILAARLRGRGLPKERYNVWMPNLGPTEHLLREFKESRIAWRDFAKRYREEIFESGDIDRRNRSILNHGQKFTLRLLQHLARQGPITLMCHCAEDEAHCHRHLLQAILQRDL